MHRLAQPVSELGREVGNSKLPLTRHVLAEQRTPNEKTLQSDEEAVEASDTRQHQPVGLESTPRVREHRVWAVTYAQRLSARQPK
jgi:hypothetical protein